MKKCFLCGKGYMINFNDETFKNCYLKLLFRKKKGFKYHDVQLTKESVHYLGYHSPCYKNVTVLSKKYNEDFKNFVKCHEANIEDAQYLSSRTQAASLTSQLEKRKLRDEQNNEETSDSNDHTSTSGAEDDRGDKYDAFGRYVATEVRQLDQHQRRMVERIIYEAIHAGKIGSLNGNSKLVVNSQTSLIEPSDDENMLCSEVEEVNSQVDAVETKVDIDEPEYLLVESFDEAQKVSGSYGVGRKRDCKVIAEKLLDLNVPAEMSQPQNNKNTCIKVETEENDNLEQAKLLQPYDGVLIKREIKTEDDDSHEDSKTEFVINKEQSSINVYRSTDAKRQRMDCTEEARILLELQDYNAKR